MKTTNSIEIGDRVKVIINERTKATSPLNLAGRYGHVAALLCPTNQWEPTAATVEFTDFEANILLEDLAKQKQQ